MGEKRRKSASMMMDGSGLEGPLDRLTSLACTLFDMPHAMISVVHGDQTLFRANVGLDQNALPRDQSASAILVGMGPGAVLVVRDAAGQEVARESVPLGTGPIDWAGTDSTGKPLASGTYSLELESHAQGVLLETRPVAAYRRVQEAQAGAGGEVLLVFAGDIRIPASGVTALRHPDSA
jgi:hypothetical protein